MHIASEKEVRCGPVAGLHVSRATLHLYRCVPYADVSPCIMCACSMHAPCHGAGGLGAGA